MVIFYNIVKVAAINSLIIYDENNSSQIASSKFLENLSLSLLDEHLHRRRSDQYVSKLLRLRIKEMFDLPTEEITQQQTSHRTRNKKVNIVV